VKIQNLNIFLYLGQLFIGQRFKQLNQLEVFGHVFLGNVKPIGIKPTVHLLILSARRLQN